MCHLNSKLYKRIKNTLPKFKNIFILNTGRCGSSSFIHACREISNYTSAHESRCKKTGKERLNYPESHIEADNRLSWFLGRLDEKYGQKALYVHLHRNPEKTAQSFLTRWDPFGIMRAYSYGILMSGKKDLEICQDYELTVRANIKMFLKDKEHQCQVRLEHIKEDFSAFWEMIEAEGDKEKALASFDKPTNTTAKNIAFTTRIRTKLFHAKILMRELFN